MRFALLIATLVLMLVIGEVVLRFWLPLGAIAYRIDEEHLHEYVPGSRKLFIQNAANGGAWISVRINEDGFRGEPLEPRGSKTRIVVYGDSFVAAEFTRLEDTYVAQLGDQLEMALGHPVETINAGVPAYGPDQIAKRMPGQLAELEPDAVVLGVTAANDFGDLIRNKLYAVDAAGALQDRSFRIGDKLRASLTPRRQSELGWLRLARALRRGLPQRWKLLGGSRPEIHRPDAYGLLARCQMDDFRNHDDVVRNLFNDQYDADMSLLPDLPTADHKRQMMLAVLGRIAEATRSVGVPLLVVVIPPAIDMKEDHLGLEVIWAQFPDYKRGRLTESVVRAASAHYMEVLDLYPVFGRNDADSLYFDVGNDHWNAKGQRLAAEVTATRLAPMLRR
jgi:hypothetical protein